MKKEKIGRKCKIKVNLDTKKGGKEDQDPRTQQIREKIEIDIKRKESLGGMKKNNKKDDRDN